MTSMTLLCCCFKSQSGSKLLAVLSTFFESLLKFNTTKFGIVREKNGVKI